VQVLYEQIVAAAGGTMAARFGIAFDLDAPYVDRFIQSRVNQLAGYVTDTTYSAIQEALAEGVSEGEGIPQLAARIRGVFEDATATRAEFIARTEVVSAANGSAWTIANNLGAGIIGAQEWLAAHDNRTRDSHAAADGQRVPLGASFSVGGVMLAYPGDPAGPPEETARCRCTIAFVPTEDL
jgi:SPP1 gp7 family putative phage head morphogenesis protein